MPFWSTSASRTSTRPSVFPGAIELPLSQLARGRQANLPQDKAVVFHCASGARTKTNGAALASLTNGNAYNMVGGIAGWKRAGFQTVRG